MTTTRVGNLPPKTLPYHIESEEAVLGCFLIDPAYALSYASELHPEHFYLQKHRWIYESIVRIAESARVDFLTLTSDLEQRNLLEAVGGVTYISQLINAVPSAIGIESYISIIVKAAHHRGLIGVAEDIARMAYAEEDVDTIIDVSTGKLRKYGLGSNSAKTAKDGAEYVLGKAEYYRQNPLRKGEVRGIDTGWLDTNFNTGGWQRGYTTYWLGLPHVGKTWTMLNVVANVCRLGGSAGLFSLEMSADTDIEQYDKTSLWERLVLSRAGVTLNAYRDGSLRPEEYDKLNEVADAISRWNLWIEDSVYKFGQIASTVHKHNRECKLDVVAIDYLKLIEYESDASTENDKMGELCKALKRLSSSADVSLHVPQQISDKKIAARGDKRPQLSDAYNTGHLSQDADVVLGLYRPDNDPNCMQVEILKDRPSGNTGNGWNWYIHKSWAFLDAAH